MRRVLFLLAALPLFTLQAQVNEMFYVPKKTVKQENVAKALAAENDGWGVEDNGNTRDVDEYNRRTPATVSASNVGSVLEAESYEYIDEGTDYDYSTRIVRFHNPTTVVVSSPWYYDVYPARYYYDYDYYYDSYWDWSIGWNRWGWGISAGWHYPHHWYWGCSPYYYPHYHHHHHAVLPVHKVHSRVPSVSLNNRGGTGRRPVASASVGAGNKPGAQVGNRRNERGSSTTGVQRNNSTGKKRESVGSSSSRTESRSSNSTYNRRSSTSVRSNSTGGSRSNRSSVGGASRSSSSRSSASPSRGGTSRGGRR